MFRQLLCLISKRLSNSVVEYLYEYMASAYIHGYYWWLNTSLCIRTPPYIIYQHTLLRPGGQGDIYYTPPPPRPPLPCPGRRPPTSPPAHGAHFPGEHPDDGRGGRRGIGGHREGHGGASGGVGRGGAPHEGSRSLVNLRGPGRGGIGMAPPLTPASL